MLSSDSASTSGSKLSISIQSYFLNSYVNLVADDVPAATFRSSSILTSVSNLIHLLRGANGSTPSLLSSNDSYTFNSSSSWLICFFTSSSWFCLEALAVILSLLASRLGYFWLDLVRSLIWYSVSRSCFSLIALSTLEMFWPNSRMYRYNNLCSSSDRSGC